RIVAIEVLEVPKDVPASAEQRDLDRGLYRPSPQDVSVVLELGPAARWVAQYYPCEKVTNLPDGWLRITLRTADTRWVRRLALRLGEDGRVVSPTELVTEVIEDAKVALSHYE
ncbi:MAG: WYL domain-containing protein, partial [Actinobacteria bacterium]|nr:WYL domain-containing protein [Actinomycetota bacterium]